MGKSITVILIQFFFLTTALFGINNQVGKIVSFTGDVWIDAFNKGDFIRVIVNDLLYDHSIIKTGTNGFITVMIQSAKKEFGPLSLISIADNLNLNSTDMDTSRFNILIQFFNKIIRNHFNEGYDEAFGSLGKTKQNSLFSLKDESSDDEITPESISFALKDIQKDIQKNEYPDALLKIIPLDNLTLNKIDLLKLNYLKGFCYYHIKDYPRAEKYLSIAYRQINELLPFNPSIRNDYESIVLMLCIANYMLKKDSRYYFDLWLKFSPD